MMKIYLDTLEFQRVDHKSAEAIVILQYYRYNFKMLGVRKVNLVGSGIWKLEAAKFGRTIGAG
jgi:hypothetical protein